MCVSVRVFVCTCIFFGGFCTPVLSSSQLASPASTKEMNHCSENWNEENRTPITRFWLICGEGENTGNERQYLV
eukprot:m.96058 g.96058  ORF g.96058 m.96058 type:complete len:74 (+) comp13921_c0_seq2:813-1034(+)